MMQVVFAIVGCFFLVCLGFTIAANAAFRLGEWLRYRRYVSLVDRLRAELSETDRWCAENPIVVATVQRVVKAMESIQKHEVYLGQLPDVESIEDFRERVRKMPEAK